MQSFLFSDWVYPSGNEFYQHPGCPDFTGVTMDANLTSNQVKKISYVKWIYWTLVEPKVVCC